MLRRLLGSTLLAASLLAGSALAALAASPHYVVGPTLTIDGLSATTTGSIAGLGNQDVTIVQEVEVATTCANPGQNADVPGQRKSFSSALENLRPENGRVNYSITTDASDLSGSCPNPKWTPSGAIVGVVVSVYQGGALVLQDMLL